MSRKAQFMKRKLLFMPQANSFLNIFTINNGLPYPNRGNQQQFPTAEPLLTAVNFSPKGRIINMKIFAKRKATFLILSYLLSIICLSEVVII